MSTSPVTLMVARRVANGRYQDLITWLHEGEQLATDFPGYLGSGALAPPPEDDEFQIIFRFVDEQTLHAWNIRSRAPPGWHVVATRSPTRQNIGVSGIEGWFGAAGQRSASLETGGGDLAGVFSGVSFVQLCPGAAVD